MDFWVCSFLVTQGTCCHLGPRHQGILRPMMTDDWCSGLPLPRRLPERSALLLSSRLENGRAGILLSRCLLLPPQPPNITSRSLCYRSPLLRHSQPTLPSSHLSSYCFSLFRATRPSCPTGRARVCGPLGPTDLLRTQVRSFRKVYTVNTV